MQRGGLEQQVISLRHGMRLVGRFDVQLGSTRDVAGTFVQICRRRGMARQRRVELGQGRQTRTRPVGLTHCHRTVEARDGAVGEGNEFVVPLDDLHPVGFVGSPRVGVQRGDRGLCLVLPEPVGRQRGLQHGHTLGDQIMAPQRAVLLGEGYQGPVGTRAGRSPGVVQQEQCQQSGDLRGVGGGRELAGQPDRLGGKVDVARVALVEHQVQDPQHRAEVAQPVQPDLADRALGAADPLGHGRFGHQVGPRYLPGGEAADRSQRKRHGRRRAQTRVCTQEVQLQRVVHRNRGTLRILDRGP